MSEAYKPCISPYLYYINWNLSNCSFALTDYDFECVFLMCDRKWFSMPSDERKIIGSDGHERYPFEKSA
ncbi:hypothetical protein Tsp_05567 [Trichinella spiralis]|uniref:hypothetical protein n=1 Tax=Trichinella spiralis TaxID=6334 RepID=UPI0001EFDF85|nr:hypothetical protein Tsp_05567 [Trichinella spiralis]